MSSVNDESSLKRDVQIKFRGIDSWNRPIYHVLNTSVYIGSTDTLFPNKEIAPNKTTEEIDDYFRDHLDELVIFGTKFDCEPDGGRIGTKTNLIIV